MRRRILYTMGNPEPELEAIRQLIARESGMDTAGLKLYSPTAKRDYGRVYYAVCDPKTETGLLFTITRSSHTAYTANEWEPRQMLSEWEIQDLFKLARTLGLYNFRMLPPLRLFQEDITALVNLNQPNGDL